MLLKVNMDGFINHDVVGVRNFSSKPVKVIFVLKWN